MKWRYEFTKFDKYEQQELTVFEMKWITYARSEHAQTEIWKYHKRTGTPTDGKCIKCREEFGILVDHTLLSI